jgi:hypothetical protein
MQSLLGQRGCYWGARTAEAGQRQGSGPQRQARLLRSRNLAASAALEVVEAAMKTARRFSTAQEAPHSAPAVQEAPAPAPPDATPEEQAAAKVQARKVAADAEALRASFARVQAEVASYKAITVDNARLQDEVARLREVRPSTRGRLLPAVARR